MELEAIAFAVGIFLVRVLGNTITTVRLILITRGNKLSSTILGFFESLIFVVVLGAVVSNLGSIVNLMAYCGGFAVGGYVGQWLEDKWTRGYLMIMVVTRHCDKGTEIAKAIRAAGFGATEVSGRGGEGEVSIVESIIERHDLAKCTEAIQTVDPTSFISVQNLRMTQRGYVPVTQPSLTRMFNQ
ncbi:MAG: DUF2179 domain-containing protein [Chloroflexi bacterium]|nr:DUF2179 domain-containing protein [Chloroflexota bacterium]